MVESKAAKLVLARSATIANTTRNITTLRRLAEKLGTS
jgi:hypothetical protein